MPPNHSGPSRGRVDGVTGVAVAAPVLIAWGWPRKRADKEDKEMVEVPA